MPVSRLRDISNTRDSVSSEYPNTEKRVEKTTRTRFRVFGNPDETLALVFEILHETLSRVVDMSSQSKLKLRKKS